MSLMCQAVSLDISAKIPVLLSEGLGAIVGFRMISPRYLLLKTSSILSCLALTFEFMVLDRGFCFLHVRGFNKFSLFFRRGWTDGKLTFGDWWKAYQPLDRIRSYRRRCRTTRSSSFLNHFQIIWF